MNDYRRFFERNADAWSVRTGDGGALVSTPRRPGWSGFGETRMLDNGVTLGRSHIRNAGPAFEPETPYRTSLGLFLLVEANYSVRSSEMGGAIDCGNGQIYRREGDLGLVGAEWRGRGEARVLSLDFDEETLERWSEDFPLPEWLRPGAGSAPMERGDGFVDPKSWLPLAASIIAQPVKTLSDRLALESMTLALCAKLFGTGTSAPPRSRIDVAVDVIRTEYRRPLSIAYLSRRCGMNECYFKRRFKEATGRSVAAYIREFRMREAMRLLLDEGRSVKEASWYVGYRNPSNFSKVFKEQYGFSPSSLVRKDDVGDEVVAFSTRESGD